MEETSEKIARLLELAALIFHFLADAVHTVQEIVF